MDFFIDHFDLALDDEFHLSEFQKKQKLVDFKNSDEIMRGWDNDIFSHFLYRYYPGRPVITAKDVVDTTVSDDICEYINLELNRPITSSKKGSRKQIKIDFNKQNKRNKEIGDKGEVLVVNYEYKRLCNLNLKLLANKIKWVSRDSDSLGYDILSYNEDGSERYIEVKATSGSVGETNFFISSNELDVAKEKGNRYYIYIVYNIQTATPKIWMSNSLFSDKNKDKINLKPINYKVTINTKRK